VQSILPEVLVLQMPVQHEELVHFIDRKYLFDALIVTDEDARRTKSYQQNRTREALFSTITDLSDYKRKLGTRLTVRNVFVADIARVAQLLQRTNQFNLTTRRHNQTEVTRMMVDPDILIICAELEDQFGDLGLIGVAIVKRNSQDALIDTMLMSCRALGRDAEFAFASAIFNTIDKQWRSQRLIAEYIPSAKNQLVAEFWNQVGLVVLNSDQEPRDTVLYTSQIKLAILAHNNMPSHVTVMDLTDER
jgi:FkbH-like protein